MSDPQPTPPVLRGVNLGNWLLLEKWMRPSLFEGTSAKDEYTLCEVLGPAAGARMLRHRDTFIQEEDFLRGTFHPADEGLVDGRLRLAAAYPVGQDEGPERLQD